MTEEHSNDQQENPMESSGPRRIDVEGAAESTASDDRRSRQELEQQLELAQAEIERLQDQSLRRQADLANYRRRAQREIAESVGVGQGRVLERLVPIIDDFERAVGVEAEDARAYHEGMELILRTMHKMLEHLGVQRLDPSGEAFDPQFHEAIARQESEDVPEGRILDVYQSGYTLGDRLIRPAAVVVAYGGPLADDQAAAEDVAATDVGEPDDG